MITTESIQFHGILKNECLSTTNPRAIILRNASNVYTPVKI
jgi:hypothetical protein